MSIIQRITILSRRLPGATPQIFWHGTSSKNLRSILVNGFDPSKIKSGNWREDRDTNEINPSKISYGGIYYAKDMSKAESYASEICRRDKSGHPLLIAVQLQELALLPDEDTYGLHRVFIDMIGQSEIKAAEILVYILTRANVRWYGGRSSWRDFIGKFRQAIMERIKLSEEDLAKRQDKDRLLGAIDAVLLASCRRYLSQIQKRGGYQDAYYRIRRAIEQIAPKLAKQLQEKTPDGENMLLPAKFKLPEPAKAEQDTAKSMDYLIKITKNYTRHSALQQEGFWKNRRTTRNLAPVGFRGRNKIIAILEFIDDTGWHIPDRTEKRIQIHYGKPPPEFMENYKNLSDKPIVWLDKTGKVIGREAPPPSSEAHSMSVKQKIEAAFNPDNLKAKSQHDKLFNQHGFSHTGNLLYRGVTHEYIQHPHPGTIFHRVKAIGKTLKTKGYKYNKISDNEHQWIKSPDDHVTANLSRGTIKHNRKE